jgi:hypothetical protein
MVVMQDYERECQDCASESLDVRKSATTLIYLPSLFLVTAPLALLPFGPAHVVWIALTAGSFILASSLIWNICANCVPDLSGALLCLCLANSEFLIFLGNPAGIAVSLCVVAVWCFVKEQYVPMGIVSLSISLMIKPHDAGLVWVYFLLAGGKYRNRALQTLVVAAVLSIPMVLWIAKVAPNWIPEQQSNVMAMTAHGEAGDPGPASSGAHSFGMMINLQTVASILVDDPRFYNPVSYLICGGLILMWSVATFRSRLRISSTNIWLALAAIVPLTMLPIYHRQSDAKLLVLTIPACAALFAEGGRIGRIAAIVTAAGLLLTRDLWFLVVSSGFILCFHPHGAGARFIISRPCRLSPRRSFY